MLAFGPPATLGCTPPGVSLCLPRLQDATKAALAGLRVGVYPTWFNDAEPSIVEVATGAVEVLKRLGLSLIHI